MNNTVIKAGWCIGLMSSIISCKDSQEGNPSVEKPKTLQEELIYPADIDSISIDDLVVHDPFILADSLTQSYYIYEKFSPERFAGDIDAPKGKAGVFYQESKDLVKWSRPQVAFVIPDNFWADDNAGPWAPEVHRYRDKYYMFTTFNAWDTLIDKRKGRPKLTWRASQILRSDSPKGPFESITDLPITPPGEMTLDATFWVEEGQPWLIYCHEWVQLGNGLIKAIKLTDDLTGTIGEPISLLSAGDVSWTKKEINYKGTQYPGAVTDGPFLYQTKSGELVMLWSSWSKNNAYAITQAISETGKISGPWKLEKTPLLWDDRGHGMMFTSFDGRLLLSLHRYFHYPQTRVQIYEVEDQGDRIAIKKKIMGSK